MSDRAECLQQLDGSDAYDSWCETMDMSNADLKKLKLDSVRPTVADAQRAIKRTFALARVEYPALCGVIEKNGQTLEDTLPCDGDLETVAEYLVHMANQESHQPGRDEEEQPSQRQKVLDSEGEESDDDL